MSDINTTRPASLAAPLASLTGLYLWVQTLGAAAPAFRQATGRDRGWEPSWIRRERAESLWLSCREAWEMPRK